MNINANRVNIILTMSIEDDGETKNSVGEIGIERSGDY